MKTFLCKLIPPRPTFVQDMSESEGRLMREHAAYWHGWMDQGRVVAFGLVADPTSPYGIAILEVENASDAQQMTAHDPVIEAACGFRYEMYPMPRGAVHPRSASG